MNTFKQLFCKHDWYLISIQQTFRLLDCTKCEKRVKVLENWR